MLAGAGIVVAAAYLASAARTVTRWDAGEFLAAIHSLGIPHPPGTPMYVLLARAWTSLPLPGDFALRVGVFSVLCAVAAVTLLGLLVHRGKGDSLATAAAILCAGGTYTLWLSATEAEVYAPALLFAVLLLIVADAGSVPPVRRWALLAYLAGVGWTLHPAALLTLPAAIMLMLGPDPRERLRKGGALRALREPRAVACVAGAAALGASAVLFLLVRAQHDPVINQGNPSSFETLWAVITRAQYSASGIWPRQAPLWLQLGNWLEYADWQFAFGLSPGAPPSWMRTPVTVLFALLGLGGSVAHHGQDRRRWWALLVVFLTATFGLIAYLNLRASPSYGHGILPEHAPREARERDYFFTTGFVIWGIWAGVGAAAAGRALSRRMPGPGTVRGVLGGALLLSATPLLLNFNSAREQRALAAQGVRATALEILRSVPHRGVLLAIGDNDTYPLWYAQVVEGARQDVTVVTIPLLAARWYREELARRHALFDLGADGTSSAVTAVCRAAVARGRKVVLTPYADAGTLTSACPGIQPGKPQSL